MKCSYAVNNDNEIMKYWPMNVKMQTKCCFGSRPLHLCYLATENTVKFLGETI